MKVPTSFIGVMNEYSSTLNEVGQTTGSSLTNRTLPSPPKAGEKSMEQFTRALVDVALDLGGTYYLPYRLHPTVDQFRRAYPKHAEFFAAKRRHDPSELFQNVFYARYGH